MLSLIHIFTKTLSYLEKSYTSDLTLNDIAQHFSYSTYYTSRLINENLGVSFSNLLRIIRINKSIELIRSTSLPLEKIAAKTGFKTYRNLYNSFYKIYDMSPIPVSYTHLAAVLTKLLKLKSLRSILAGCN